MKFCINLSTDQVLPVACVIMSVQFITVAKAMQDMDRWKANDMSHMSAVTMSPDF